MSNGTAYCWGYDGEGEVGVGTNSDQYATPQTLALTNVLKIDGGGDHGCALLSDQSVHCWGGNFYGEVGDGTGTEQDSPVATGITNAIDLSMGLGYHSCAILSTGGAQCWGEDDYGECGDGTTVNFDQLSPVDVVSLSGAVSVQLGNNHSCAAVSGGTAKCWGLDAVDRGGPNGGVTHVVAAGAHACVLVSGGAVRGRCHLQAG